MDIYKIKCSQYFDNEYILEIETESNYFEFMIDINYLPSSSKLNSIILNIKKGYLFNDNFKLSEDNFLRIENSLYMYLNNYQFNIKYNSFIIISLLEHLMKITINKECIINII